MLDRDESALHAVQLSIHDRSVGATGRAGGTARGALGINPTEHADLRGVENYAVAILPDRLSGREYPA